MIESQQNLQKEQASIRSELCDKNGTISDLVASLVLLNEKVFRKQKNGKRQMKRKGTKD